MDDGWLERKMAGNGTAERGGLTEAYLTEEGFTAEARKREVRGPGCAWSDSACLHARSSALRCARFTRQLPRSTLTPGLLRCPSLARPQDELPEGLANSSNTIAWWQSRQAEVQARLKERRKAVGRTISEATSNGKQAVSKIKLLELVNAVKK